MVLPKLVSYNQQYELRRRVSKIEIYRDWRICKRNTLLKPFIHNYGDILQEECYYSGYDGNRLYNSGIAICVGSVSRFTTMVHRIIVNVKQKPISHGGSSSQSRSTQRLWDFSQPST